MDQRAVTQAWGIFLLMGLIPGLALSTPAIETLPPEIWGQPDESLGLGGGIVEDFEDTSLIPGLFIEISDVEGAFTGVGSPTLPAVFDPVNGDPFGDSFAAGVWDGSHVLVNTEGNQSIYYGSQDWRPVAFYFPEGASWIALATQQVTVNHFLVVNGVNLNRLGTYGFQLDPGPNGMLIVRSTDPQEPITSVSFGGRGDAFVVDHLVVEPSGVLPTRSTNWGQIKAAFR